MLTARQAYLLRCAMHGMVTRHEYKDPTRISDIAYMIGDVDVTGEFQEYSPGFYHGWEVSDDMTRIVLNENGVRLINRYDGVE
jgi:hypothetical protein